MLTREDYVEQSVQDYLKAGLLARGYSQPDHYKLLDAFQGKPLPTPLEANFVATGYNFDDGGKPLEMGSSFVVRLYTIEFFVFGTSPTWGRNLANGIKFSLENDGIIPIVDIAVAGRPLTQEVLVLDNVSAERVVINDPADWQRNVWTVHLRVEDTYDSRFAG